MRGKRKEKLKESRFACKDRASGWVRVESRVWDRSGCGRGCSCEVRVGNCTPDAAFRSATSRQARVGRENDEVRLKIRAHFQLLLRRTEAPSVPPEKCPPIYKHHACLFRHDHSDPAMDRRSIRHFRSRTRSPSGYFLTQTRAAPAGGGDFGTLFRWPVRSRGQVRRAVSGTVVLETVAESFRDDFLPRQRRARPSAPITPARFNSLGHEATQRQAFNATARRFCADGNIVPCPLLRLFQTR